MPARSIDSATISFGLVTIPVKVYSTNQPSEELHFHMVHAGCGRRLKQRYVCPEHGEIERSDIVKGFELSKGNVVELDKSELEALEAVASDDIALAEFVPVSAVDPVYIDSHYYLGPDKGGDRAFRLFRDALEDSELVGIAAYAARGKQYVVMLRPFEDGLAMHQLRYPDEIKPWSEVPIGRSAQSKTAKPSAAELTLAKNIIDSLRHDTFDPSQYSDEVKTRVRKLIAQKAKGGEISMPEVEEKPVEAVDLMAALKASLTGEKAHAKATPKGKPHATRGHAAARAPRSRPHPARTRSHAGTRRRAAKR